MCILCMCVCPMMISLEGYGGTHIWSQHARDSQGQSEWPILHSKYPSKTPFPPVALHCLCFLTEQTVTPQLDLTQYLDFLLEKKASIHECLPLQQAFYLCICSSWSPTSYLLSKWKRLRFREHKCSALCALTYQWWNGPNPTDQPQRLIKDMSPSLL